LPDTLPNVLFDLILGAKKDGSDTLPETERVVDCILSLPIYPEDRLCRKPTTECILSLFQNQRRQVLKEKGETLRIFNDPLPELPEQVLNLLGVSARSHKK